MEEPPADFLQWWEPSGTDEESGASIGGHSDAERVWARHDPGKWARTTIGITAREAWNTWIYRDEYETWISRGRQPRAEFRSMAASLGRQQQFWQELRKTLANIGRL